jgi:hypothetical protein
MFPIVCLSLPFEPYLINSSIISRTRAVASYFRPTLLSTSPPFLYRDSGETVTLGHGIVSQLFHPNFIWYRYFYRLDIVSVTLLIVIYVIADDAPQILELSVVRKGEICQHHGFESEMLHRV